MKGNWLSDVILRTMATFITSKTLEGLFERLRVYRLDREKRSPHTFDESIEMGVDTPEWWYGLETYVKGQKWEHIDQFRPLFVEHLRKANSPYRERGLMWIAQAAHHRGYYEDAISIYESALDACKHEPIRALILLNQATAYGHKGQLDKAVELVDKSLKINPRDDMANLNGMGAASLKKEATRCDYYAKQLKRFHPVADDPTSEIGKWILTDPDLEFYRTTPQFAALFSRLAAHMKKKRGSDGERRAGKAALPLIALLGVMSLLGVLNGFLSNPISSKIDVPVLDDARCEVIEAMEVTSSDQVFAMGTKSQKENSAPVAKMGTKSLKSELEHYLV